MYIHSRDDVLDYVVLCYGLAIVFGVTLYSTRAYLHHWTLTLTTCDRSPEGRHILSAVLHVPKEGMSSVQCCSQREEVAL